jgi:hypothetical protein
MTVTDAPEPQVLRASGPSGVDTFVPRYPIRAVIVSG